MSRRRTTTPWPTACTGAPTAGSTAAAGRRRRARSASPARPMPQRIPIYGGIWRFHPVASVRDARPRHDEPLGQRLERPRRGVLRQHGQRPPLASDGRGALRRGAHDRPQPAGLFADRHARRPLALGQRQGLDRLALASGEHDRRGGGHAHCGADGLPGRPVARRLPRQALHPEPARPAGQRRSARARRAAATSAGTSPT